MTTVVQIKAKTFYIIMKTDQPRKLFHQQNFSSDTLVMWIGKKRGEDVPSGDEVIDNMKDRIIGLTEEDAIKEASRCMSCGMCFECDNCVIYCPQDAVFRVKKDEATLGRYVDTDYNKCIGCHICADVCPTGYIKMGLGE